jgi:hypothetical protein
MLDYLTVPADPDSAPAVTPKPRPQTLPASSIATGEAFLPSQLQKTTVSPHISPIAHYA